MLRVHDTSAAHSTIYQELGMEKYGSELLLTHGEARRYKESEKEIRCSGWQLEGRKGYKRVKEWIKVMVFLYSLLESPNADTDQLLWICLYCW